MSTTMTHFDGYDCRVRYATMKMRIFSNCLIASIHCSTTLAYQSGALTISVPDDYDDDVC